MLIDTLFAVAIVLAALVSVPSLAHALELPGKMRLSEAEYRVVQRIYYPGFTLVGIAEVGAPLAVLVLLLLVPTGSAQFWLLCFALGGFVAVQAVFWLVTQPVNRRWVASVKLGAAGSRFFGAGSRSRTESTFAELRVRWEYSHLVRAALAVLSLVAIAIAAAERGVWCETTADQRAMVGPPPAIRPLR
jgi:hypothetical protein